MDAKVIQDGPETTFALVFDDGEEVMSGLQGFAQERGVTGAHFTAIGAFREAVLGFFDVKRKTYDKIAIPEQVEVLALAGNVALHEGRPKVHAHAVVGKRDGTAHGGHLLRAHVRPTLEVVLVESSGRLQRRTDPKTGLPLLDL
ncbi:MAG TPA: PPC domain-containing DNA-binding protein [Methylomirabilota bacterium]|nr:PPC domain-containing DNA-binding protein [Methylomirabilota bacterium]